MLLGLPLYFSTANMTSQNLHHSLKYIKKAAVKGTHVIEAFWREQVVTATELLFLSYI